MAAVLGELGFPPLADVDSVAESTRQGSRRRRRGLYVLYFANHEYYVGETLDLRARLGAHRRAHDDITHVSFKPIPGPRRSKPDLRQAERSAIARCFERLSALGVHTRGIAYVPRPRIETDFDFLMPAETQRRWESDLTQIDLEGDRPLDEQARRRYQVRFDRFWKLPQATASASVLRRYVQLCVPACSRGESWFWSCSCMPSGNTELLVRLNVGWQAVLDVTRDGRDARFAWYVPLSAAERFYQMDLGPYDDLEWSVIDVETHDGEWLFETELDRVVLSRGGPDQVAIMLSGAEAAMALLHSENAVLAFRSFNLGLMNQGPTPWGANHCFSLADHFSSNPVTIGRLL
jgi:hypothetical protein